MSDRLEEYRRSDTPLPEVNWLWPLYGAGFGNMGRNGNPISVLMPKVGSQELLVRHDAVGLCFSDVKVVMAGETHPRIARNMQKDPVVMGHEVSVTVVGIGADLRDQYALGDRMTLETDIVYQGVPLAYGYMLQGGLSQYSVVDRRILNSDEGNCLIPINPERGYAEIALTEPWACVVAAYSLEYRTRLKPGGTTWIIGAGGNRPYSVDAGFNATSHPARLLLTNVPMEFAHWLRGRAGELGMEVMEVSDVSAPPDGFIDDIVLLGGDAGLIERVSPRLGLFGILAILADTPLPRRVNVDIGRIHYHRWLYVGGTSGDIGRAYSDVPVCANLKPGGSCWFVGGGGPMGRMHVQRAIQFSNSPSAIVCTDISDMRLRELRDSFSAEAKAKGIELVCLNPSNEVTYAGGMAPFYRAGFGNIVVLAPNSAVIADAATHLAPGGLMNVFAGVTRGTKVNLDLSDVYLRNVRIVGHSASHKHDMELVLEKTNMGELSPLWSVAAIGSLRAARDGLQAVKNATLAGKVVIYPHIKEMPLTPLRELKHTLPAVYARLGNGREWTNEAEEEFLRLMLP